MINERNPYYIGKGNYLVYFKDPINGNVKKFIGQCENFNNNGLSAFWNKENENMLVVKYTDLVGLYPIH